MSRAAHVLRSASNRATRRIAIRYAAPLRMRPVIGFPRSGGTWLSKMLAAAADLPFAQVPVLPVAMPSVVHGHWDYHPNLRNTTFIVRDGRDVMVSFYFYCRLLHEHGPAPRVRRMFRRLYGPNPDLGRVRDNLPRFIEEMFARPIGIRHNWPDYCTQWTGRRGVPVVRYERLVEDPASEIARLLDAHALPAPAERIRLAVELNAMDRTTGRRPGEEDTGSIVRKGVTGDWKTHFSDDARRTFAELGGRALVELGYEKSPDWRDWDVEPAQAGDGSDPSSAVSP